MKLSPIYALLLATMASTGFAQTASPPPTDTSPSANSTTPANTAPTSSSTSQMPTTSSSSMSASANQTATDAQQKDPHNIQSSGPETWGMLQGHEKGYISKTDATPNSWIAQNFSACDKDRDGKVTQDEYAKCDKKQH